MNELEEARIKKVGVLSVANLSAIVNLFIGILAGLAVFAFSFAAPLPGIPSNLSYLLIIIFPIAYGIVGFIAGAIGAFFYNIAAKITKGVVLYS